MIDLDLIENIAHPLWETLDPVPDVRMLLKRFSFHFFNNDFRLVENDEELNDFGDYPYPIALVMKKVVCPFFFQ